MRDINGVCEITTPFLDRHNDRIQIYVHKVNGNLRLSDEGTTIADLELSGCGVATPNRKRVKTWGSAAIVIEPAFSFVSRLGFVQRARRIA